MRGAPILLFALVLALTASCGSNLTVGPGSSQSPTEGGASAPLPVVPIRWANVLAVAEDAAPRPAGAPMSLTSAEGVGLEIKALSARSVIADPLAFTELHFTFKNPEPRAIEGRFEMTLPPGATISRFAMKSPEGWQEGEVVELQAARAAYEDFLHRRSDPALLEKQAGNRFQARVFPIPASGDKEVIVSYSQELTSAGDPYRLYLRGLPRLGRLDLRVIEDTHDKASPGRRAFELHEADFLPDRDFAIPLPGAIPGHGLRNEDIAVSRIRPITGSRPDPIRDLLVLLDTSASRALDFKLQVDRLATLLSAIQKQSGAEVPIAVACFDQELESIYVGPVSGFGRRHLDAILERRALGASDLGFALSSAAAFAAKKGKAFHRALLLTDGIPTAGPTEASDLKADLRRLREAGFERLDVIAAGGIRDESLLRALAVGGLLRDGVILDADLAPRVLAERLGQTTSSGIKVSVDGAGWVWPTMIAGVQPGDDVLVYASLPRDRPFTVKLTGPEGSSTHAVSTAVVERPLLERAAVKAQIERLSRARDEASNDKTRAGLQEDIIALSTKHRVLSDFTALLVLETDADYARFHIDRSALSDILVVGSSGVDLLHRSAPAGEQQVAAEEPSEGKRGGDAKEKQTSDQKPSETLTLKKEDSGGAPSTGAAPGAPGAAASPPPPPPLPAPSEDFSRPKPSPAPAPRAVREAPPAAKPAASAAPQLEPSRAPPRAAGASRPTPRAAAADPIGRDSDEESAPSRRLRRPVARDDADERGEPPYEGKFAEVMKLLSAKRAKEALALAVKWHEAELGDVLALVAMGEAYEALGNKDEAARCYGSIIDLFPSRADLRRFAGNRLERLGAGIESSLGLAIDTYQKAVAARPDHPSSHRFLAYALARAGYYEKAFDAILAGFLRGYPSGRFAGARHVLFDDVGILAAAWIQAEPGKREEIARRARGAGVPVATRRSLRFVLTWETDANDVDFHINDGRGAHAYYEDMALPSGGELYADVTTGYGPECFAIPDAPRAYPYRLRAHYYAKGPMGYGMGKLEVLEHDGHGGLRFEERSFVVMTNRAFVDLGVVSGPLKGK